MENRKDIGKAINDKLSLLDKTPTEQVWIGINEELQKKKKRRIGFFFFWGKALGLLLICAIAGLYIYHQNDGFNFSSPSNSKQNINLNGINKEVNTNYSVVENSKIKSNESNITSSVSIDDKNATESKNHINGKNNINEKNDANYVNSTNSETENSSSKTNRKINSGSISSKAGKSNSKLLSKASSRKSEGELGRKSAKKSKKKTKKENAGLISSETKINKDTPKIVDLSSLQSKTSGDLTSDVKTKKTDSISKKEKEKTITINMYPKDSIQKDSAKIYRKVDVDAFVSPTLYGFFTKGSALDRRLDSLAKKSEIKFSYGFGLTYELTEKMSVRIGYRKINISYITKNAPIDVSNYSGIDYDPNISNETILNASQEIDSPNKMDITQKISYTEIPIEFKYKFVDKKIGVKSSLGFSYLLLNENKVSIKTANGFSQDIGKTKGLSRTSLSANLGVEFDYPLFKNMKIFVEPMLNYQVKAFSNSNFKPYIFGVHTGIRYSFNNK